MGPHPGHPRCGQQSDRGTNAPPAASAPSLQAEVTLTLPPEDHALLASLGDDARFVFIVSALTLRAGAALAVSVTPSPHPKCARCWHWRADVGHDPAHPHLCGRCTSNLFGAGEPRHAA
jgi:isoleucyl-tRNA synthetase